MHHNFHPLELSVHVRSERPAAPCFQSSEYDMVSSLATMISSENREEAKPGQSEQTLRLRWVLSQQGAKLAHGKSSVPGGHPAIYRKSLPESKVNNGESVAQKWPETGCRCDTGLVLPDLDLPLVFTDTGATALLLHLPSSSCHLEFKKPASSKLCTQALKRLSAEFLWRNK